MSDDFSQAMLATLARDATGKPCVVCKVPSRSFGVWEPTVVTLLSLGLDASPRRIVYPICLRCGQQAQQNVAFASHVEDAVLDGLRCQGLIPAGVQD